MRWHAIHFRAQKSKQRDSSKVKYLDTFVWILQDVRVVPCVVWVVKTHLIKKVTRTNGARCSTSETEHNGVGEWTKKDAGLKYLDTHTHTSGLLIGTTCAGLQLSCSALMRVCTPESLNKSNLPVGLKASLQHAKVSLACCFCCWFVVVFSFYSSLMLVIRDCWAHLCLYIDLCQCTCCLFHVNIAQWQVTYMFALSVIYVFHWQLGSCDSTPAAPRAH